MNALQANDLVRFGGCEIYSSRRELYRNGELCELEPRTFALLLYLIEHRDQVVTKDELLRSVWGTTHVTESVIPRAIMKLRKVVDDDDATSTYLKTIHRVGYRFVGQIIEPGKSVEPGPIAKPKPIEARAATTRVAFLPFQNLTGDPSFDWVEWGLVTLAQRAVAAASQGDHAGAGADHFNIVPVEQVISALGGIMRRLDVREQIEKLSELLVTNCIASSISRENADFVLEWEFIGSKLGSQKGRHQGPNPSQLVQALSEAVITALHRSPEQEARGFDSDDVFLNEAYARAMHAFQKAEYPKALALIEICVEREDHPVQIDIDYVAILSRLGDARCVPIGQAALANARATHQVSHQASILRWMRNYLGREQNWRLAEEFADALAQIVGDIKDAEEVALIQMSLLDHAYLRGQLDPAAELCEALLRADDEISDKNGIAFAYTMRGCISRLRGNHAAAIADLERAMDVAERHHIRYRLEVARVELGMTYLSAGTMAQAEAILKQALGSMHQIGDPRLRSLALHGMCVVSLRQGALPTAERYVAELNQIDASASSLVARHRRLSEIIVALAQDDLDQADDAIGLASDLFSSDPVEFCRQLRLLIAAPLRLHHHDTALNILTSANALDLSHSGGLMEANMLHAFAQYEHSIGNGARSRELLFDGLAALPSPKASWLMSMDAIWLAIEAGDDDGAAPLVHEVESILGQTWMGLATLARYQFSIGNLTQAVKTQALCVAMNASPSSRSQYLADLMERYAAYTRRNEVPIPPIDFLPSVF